MHFITLTIVKNTRRYTVFDIKMLLKQIKSSQPTLKNLQTKHKCIPAGSNKKQEVLVLFLLQAKDLEVILKNKNKHPHTLIDDLSLSDS